MLDLQRNNNDNLAEHIKMYPGEITVIAGSMTYLQRKANELKDDLNLNEIHIGLSGLSLISKNNHILKFIKGKDVDAIRGILVSGFIIGHGSSQEMYEALKERNNRFLLTMKTINEIKPLQINENPRIYS